MFMAVLSITDYDVGDKLNVVCETGKKNTISQIKYRNMKELTPQRKEPSHHATPLVRIWRNPSWVSHS
jgi:hypothetical protein